MQSIKEISRKYRIGSLLWQEEMLKRKLEIAREGITMTETDALHLGIGGK